MARGSSRADHTMPSIVRCKNTNFPGEGADLAPERVSLPEPKTQCANRALLYLQQSSRLPVAESSVKLCDDFLGP